MSEANVLAFLAAPSRADCLRAISLAVLRIRAKNITFKQIAQAIDVCADTVEGAANERSLLAFDAVERLKYFWPDDCAALSELSARAPDRLTITDRFDDIERSINTLRKLVGDADAS